MVNERDASHSMGIPTKHVHEMHRAIVELQENVRKLT